MSSEAEDISDCNGNAMGDNCQQKCADETPEVITIDDDDDSDNVDDNFDETDDIEILEDIDPNSQSVMILDSSKLSDTKESITDQKTNETIVQKKSDSSDSCLQTDDSIEDDSNKSMSNDISDATVVPADDQKNVINGNKRINPVTLAKQPSTSASNGSPDSPSDQRPNKVRRITDLKAPKDPNTLIYECPPMNPSPSTSCPKPDSETVFNNYLKAFRKQMIELKAKDSSAEECVLKLEDIHLKLSQTNPGFLKTKQFSKLMEVFTEEILEFKTKYEVMRHHNDLVLELKRLAKNKDNKEPIKVKNKAKKIMGFTATLMTLQQQIFKAENEVLDYESMENESSFTGLPKLYRKVHEVWTKREELLKRSTSTGKSLFKKYKYNSTAYPEINNCVENLFTDYLKKFRNKSKGYVDESFTFIDVRKAILDVIKDNNLVVMNCESMIENIYKDLLTEKRNRRKVDTEEMFETLETLDDLKPESFVESDPELDLQLAKNKKGCDEKMQALFEKFEIEDRKKNGDSVLVDGSNEWDTDVADNSEEFESLDVNDGELEEDNDDESDEDVVVEDIEPIADGSDSDGQQDSNDVIDSFELSQEEIKVLSQMNISLKSSHVKSSQ